MGTDHRSGPWTEENNDQDVEVVNTCSCTYCDAMPGDLCVTAARYIAQKTHKDRVAAWRKRAGPAKAPRPEWEAVPPALARVLTIEVILPRDSTLVEERMLEQALYGLRSSEGLAEITGIKYVCQDMREASTMLKLRKVKVMEDSITNQGEQR